MKKILAALLLAVAASSAVPAERTQLVPLFVNGTRDMQVFLEKDSLRQAKNGVEFRVHLLFTPSREEPYDVNGIFHEFEEPVSKVVDTVVLSCDGQIYETLKSDFYNMDSEVIWTLDHRGTQVVPVDSETVSGIVYAVICKRKAAPRQST